MSTHPIPPRELRIGVGPFADPKLFLDSGVQTLELFRDRTGLLPYHSVLDVGCGCGRVALALRAFLTDGKYVGVDPWKEYVDWCNTHIAAVDSRFSFMHLNITAPPYHDVGETSASLFRFPFLGDFDRGLFSSVFTHMYPDATANYVRQLAPLLKPGGKWLVSAMLMNDATRTAVASGTTLFRFKHPAGTNAWTFDPECPTEGIALEESWFSDLLSENGLVVENIDFGNWREVKSHAIQHDWITVGRQQDRVV